MRTIAFTFVTLLFACSALAASEPTITFDGSRIQVSGLTPGGSAIFFGVGTERVDYSDLGGRWTKIVADDDRDGAVTYDFGRNVPATTIWAVVDLTNAHYAIAAPGHSVPVARVLPQPFRRGKAAAVDTFSFASPTLEMLYVHPGRGAWMLSAMDGNKYDRDERRDVTGVSLLDAVPVVADDGPKPAEFVPGGVLIAIEWNTLTAFATRITGADLGGAH